MVGSVALDFEDLGALFLTFNAMFQHANIRTPKWLGYIIQRPESHGVHHARGVHRYNYSDLPLWDIVFGTFRNPDAFEGECGLTPGASARLGAMLLGQDVSINGDRRPHDRVLVEHDADSEWTTQGAGV